MNQMFLPFKNIVIFVGDFVLHFQALVVVFTFKDATGTVYINWSRQ